MKPLNQYIMESVGSKTTLKEGLFDDIDKREKLGGLNAAEDDIKKEIISWMIEHHSTDFSNSKSSQLKPSMITVDTTTTPPTVYYKSRQKLPIMRIKNTTSVNNNGMFQWGDVKLDFILPACIEDLSGLPKVLHGSLMWNVNDRGERVLKSLKGCPEEIYGSVNIGYLNNLTSLEGAPKKIDGNFYCVKCKSLKSLKGAPEEVSGWFNCSQCSSLKDLKGSPKEIGGNFICNWCTSLTSLKGVPKKIGGGFSCGHCTSLESLEGAPEEIHGSFDCSYCPITSLEGAPKEVKIFDCSYCKTKFTEEDVRKVSDVDRYIYC